MIGKALRSSCILPCKSIIISYHIRRFRLYMYLSNERDSFEVVDASIYNFLSDVPNRR